MTRPTNHLMRLREALLVPSNGDQSAEPAVVVSAAVAGARAVGVVSRAVCRVGRRVAVPRRHVGGVRTFRVACVQEALEPHGGALAS